jgi:N-formylglutamate amidohydrolase
MAHPQDPAASVADVIEGEGPLVAAAIHDGHALRPEVAALIALDASARLREEDPFTADWTVVAPTRVVGRLSRFEVDLNRPREGAVYLTPKQAWGLDVWKRPPTPDVVARSLAAYDAFYDRLRRLLDEKARAYGRFIVYDLHNYNHRRDGPSAPPADPAANPQINLGTGTMNRQDWAPVIDRFVADLRAAGAAAGHPLDVRENVRFRGGYLATWIHSTWPGAGCVLSVEVKKFFMDEWTGRPYPGGIEHIRTSLGATVPGVLEALGKL